MFDLLGLVHEVVGVCLWNELALIGLLNKVFVSLLLREQDGVLLGLEVDVSALHDIARGLPAHERVLPSVALSKNIPIHSPMMTVPCTGLGRGLRGFVDSEELK